MQTRKPGSIDKGQILSLLTSAKKTSTTRDWLLAAEDAKQLKLANCIQALKRDNAWAFRQLKKSSTPKQLKISHWDYLLDELQCLQADLVQERRWKISAAYYISHAVAIYYANRNKGIKDTNVDSPDEGLSCFISPNYQKDLDKLPTYDASFSEQEHMKLAKSNKIVIFSPLMYDTITYDSTNEDGVRRREIDVQTPKLGPPFSFQDMPDFHGNNHNDFNYFCATSGVDADDKLVSLVRDIGLNWDVIAKLLSSKCMRGYFKGCGLEDTKEFKRACSSHFFKSIAKILCLKNLDRNMSAYKRKKYSKLFYKKRFLEDSSIAVNRVKKRMDAFNYILSLAESRKSEEINTRASMNNINRHLGAQLDKQNLRSKEDEGQKYEFRGHNSAHDQETKANIEHGAFLDCNEKSAPLCKEEMNAGERANEEEHKLYHPTSTNSNAEKNTVLNYVHNNPMQQKVAQPFPHAMAAQIPHQQILIPGVTSAPNGLQYCHSPQILIQETAQPSQLMHQIHAIPHTMQRTGQHLQHIKPSVANSQRHMMMQQMLFQHQNHHIQKPTYAVRAHSTLDRMYDYVKPVASKVPIKSDQRINYPESAYASQQQRAYCRLLVRDQIQPESETEIPIHSQPCAEPFTPQMQMYYYNQYPNLQIRQVQSPNKWVVNNVHLYPMPIQNVQQSQNKFQQHKNLKTSNPPL